jgi:hypothetical protein
MRRVSIFSFAVAVSIALTGTSAGAQWGKLLKESAEFAGKKLFKEGAQEATEAASKKLLREATQESGEQLLKRSGLLAARYSDEAASAIAKHGDSVVPLINQFGDDAAKAVSQLSGRNARRLSMLSDELATVPQGQEVLQLVAKGGKADQIVEFLWSHKGKIASTAVLASLLANTDAVLEAGTAITVAGVTTTGDSLVKPLAEEAGPTFRYALGGGLLLMLSSLFLGTAVVSIYVYRRYRHATRFIRGAAWMMQLARKK